MSNRKGPALNSIEGFTLIEMLVVIAVIGILSAAVLTALGPSRAKAKDARIISALNQFRILAETNYNGNYDGVPTSFNTANPSTEFDKVAKEIDDNQGQLTATKSSQPALDYAAWSPLATPNSYYCVDSAGSSKALQNSPGNVAVCP